MAKKEETVKYISLPKAVAVSDAMQMHHPTSSTNKFVGGGIRAGAMDDCLEDLGLSDDDADDQPAVDMTAKLIKRRRREARRRQLGCYPGSLAEKQGHFLTNVVRRLISAIPDSERKELLSAIRAYVDHVTSPQEFRDVIQGLVDEHAVIVELDYMPEHEARAVSAKDLEQARIRSHRTNASQAQARKRSAGQQGAAAEGISKRLKVECGRTIAENAMEALDVPSLQESDERGCPACDLDMLGEGMHGGGSLHTCGNSGASRQPSMDHPGSARGRGAAASHRQAPPPSAAAENWQSGYASQKGGVRQQQFWMPSGPAPSSNDLPNTALGAYLTQQAQRVAAPEREVRVRVVAQTENSTGGGFAQRYMYRCKSIVAFQKLDEAEVIFFGMYVHEFGPQSASPAAGRVYIECLDSIPLHGDRPADRQQLLTTVVHSYLRFIRSQGFRHVHIRVPPPSAENSHIFAYRSLRIRLEATLRMAQWYKRLLEGALQAGVVSSFEGESHLSKIESFPPCILPAADIAEEHAFSAMRSTAARLRESGNQEGVDASVLQRLVSFKERFFVAHLVPSDTAARKLEVDDSPLHMCPVVSRRRDLIAVCARERLSFTTLDSAKFATAFILRRLIAFNNSTSPMPTEGGREDFDNYVMPDWVHSQQQQLPPAFDDDECEDGAPANRRRMTPTSVSYRPMRSAAARKAPSAQQEITLRTERVAPVSLVAPGDVMLQDGAELVREDGALEPLGDLDDAELFADSLFSA